MFKSPSIDGVGVSRDTVSREIRPGAGFETGDFVKEKLGGGIVERLEREVEQTVLTACMCTYVSRPAQF